MHLYICFYLYPHGWRSTCIFSSFHAPIYLLFFFLLKDWILTNLYICFNPACLYTYIFAFLCRHLFLNGKHTFDSRNPLQLLKSMRISQKYPGHDICNVIFYIWLLLCLSFSRRCFPPFSNESTRKKCFKIKVFPLSTFI